MKRKRIIIAVSALALIMTTYFPIKKILGKADFMTDWGKVLHDNSESKAEDTQKQSDINYKISALETDSNNTVSGDDIFEAGNDVLISNQEIEVAKAFYLLQGQNEKDAKQAAIKYVEEYNAMYVEAVNNGYDVTENEIDEYIADLKVMAEQAENSYDAKKVIDQFDSEDEYWNYQKNICKKQLPVQKYVKSLEQEYATDIGGKIDSAENTAMWNSELNSIKEAAAKKQQYKKMDAIHEIDKKFEAKQ